MKRDILVKIRTTTGDYSTAAGLRTKSFIISSGDSIVSVKGSGVYKDQSSRELVEKRAEESILTDMRIVMPEFGSLTGQFRITYLSYTENFDIAFESVGEVSSSSK